MVSPLRHALSFVKSCAFSFVAAVEEEKSNKSSHNDDHCRNDDPYPYRDSAGSFSAADFDLDKKNRRKVCYVDGSGCGACGSKEFYLNNGVFACFVCKGGKTGRINDNKAVNSVFLDEPDICNGGFKIGFGGIEIGVLAIGHIIVALIFSDVHGVHHCKNIASVVGSCVRLGSVEFIVYGTFGFSVIGKTVNEKGDIKSRKGIAVRNKFCGRIIGNAVTVDGNNADAGILSDIFLEEIFDFGYRDIAVDAERKAYGFKNVLFRGFRNGRAGAGGAGAAAGRGTAGAGAAGSYAGAGF